MGGMPPGGGMGGMPGAPAPGGGTPAEKLKATNVWDVLETLLGGGDSAQQEGKPSSSEKKSAGTKG
jgi:hypothetical protein